MMPIDGPPSATNYLMNSELMMPLISPNAGALI